MTTAARRIDPAGLILGALVPLVCAICVLLYTAMVDDRLPDRLAIHWSGAAPDGFVGVWPCSALVALVIVVVGGGTAAMSASAAVLLLTRSVLLIVGLSVTGLLLALQLTILTVQIDVTDPSHVRLPMWPASLGVLVGFVIGVVGATHLRDGRARSVATRPPPQGVPRRPGVPLTDHVGVNNEVRSIIGLTLVVPGVVVGIVTQSVWSLAIFVPAALMVFWSLHATVTVDSTGLRVGSFGVLAFDVGISEITSAQVTYVKPLMQFGGWGLRVRGPGDYGFVTNRGSGIVVETAAGQRFTVSTSKAERMAGVLNTFADARFRMSGLSDPGPASRGD